MTIKELGIFALIHNLSSNISEVCNKLNITPNKAYSLRRKAKQAGFPIKKYKTTTMSPETIAHLTRLLAED